MNEELQTALAEIITTSLQTADAAKDFVLAELPDVVHQLLMWKMMESFLVFLTSVFFFMTWYWVRLFLKKGIKKYSFEKESLPIGTAMATVPSVIIGFLVLTESRGMDWLQILIAPKIYLLEYAANLVK